MHDIYLIHTMVIVSEGRSDYFASLDPNWTKSLDDCAQNFWLTLFPVKFNTAINTNVKNIQLYNNNCQYRYLIKLKYDNNTENIMIKYNII